jgi:hypothetical protein
VNQKRNVHNTVTGSAAGKDQQQRDETGEFHKS